MNRPFRTLMLTGITAASLTLIAAGVNAEQRMGRDNAVFIARTDGPRGMEDGPMGMHGPGHGQMGDMDIMRMAESLGLTREQRDRIGKIIDDTRPKLRKNGFDMMDNRKELHTLMQEDKLDDKKLRSLTRRQGDLMADMMYLQMKTRADVRSVLTDEQRDKMKERSDMSFRRGMKDKLPPKPGEDN